MVMLVLMAVMMLMMAMMTLLLPAAKKAAAAVVVITMMPMDLVLDYVGNDGAGDGSQDGIQLPAAADLVSQKRTGRPADQRTSQTPLALLSGLAGLALLMGVHVALLRVRAGARGPVERSGRG